MCGRYAASRSPEDLVEEFEVEEPTPERLEPSYNVAPTQRVYGVLERVPREQPEHPPVRRLEVLRWGLVPSWAKDPSIGSRMINARVETVAEKPAFRRAFASRRCLLPADGYFEWYKSPDALDAKGKPRKQPFFIRPADRSTLAFAGLYEFWKDPAAVEGADGTDPWLVSCTVITTEATDALGRIHDRMPMLVERDRWGAWLDPADADQDRLLGLLVPAAPGRLEAYPVSTAVNNVRNDSPALVEPLPVEDVPVEFADDAAHG